MQGKQSQDIRSIFLVVRIIKGWVTWQWTKGLSWTGAGGGGLITVVHTQSLPQEDSRRAGPAPSLRGVLFCHAALWTQRWSKVETLRSLGIQEPESTLPGRSPWSPLQTLFFLL